MSGGEKQDEGEERIELGQICLLRTISMGFKVFEPSWYYHKPPNLPLF